jgi:hypothetical protein
LQPFVDLAPGADSSVLAQFYAERVRENVTTPRGRAAFFSLKATIFVVDFDSGHATTLRFDHGRLTLHEGTIGMPSVTFGGPRLALLSLDRLRLRALPAALFGRETPEISLVDREETRPSSPPPSLRSGPPSPRRGVKLTLRELVQLYLRGELRIYGLAAHPRTVSKFLRLVSSSS